LPPFLSIILKVFFRYLVRFVLKSERIYIKRAIFCENGEFFEAESTVLRQNAAKLLIHTARRYIQKSE